jgi:tetratricopeptide (TPR) repeat protein
LPNSSKIMLIIGIDTYQNEDLEPLPSCKKDAIDLSELLLEKGFENYEGSPFIGSKLIREEYGWARIHEAVINFFQEAKPSQTLLFYFSGHGIPGRNDVFLTTPHVNPKKPRARGFALSELTSCMASSKSKRIVGIIDACCSGSTDLPATSYKRKSSKQIANQALASYDKVWKKTPKTKGTSLLLSSQSYESSIAVEGGNSLYTKYLIEGLRGVKSRTNEEGVIIPGSIDQYGNVTPESLHNYVYYQVANVAEQVPEKKIDSSSAIILARYPELAKKLKEVSDFEKEFEYREEELRKQLRKDFEKLAQELRTSRITTPKATVDVAKEGAKIEIEEKKIGQAKNTLENLLMKETLDELKAHNSLGVSYLEEKKWESARYHFEKSLQINPNSAEALNNLGKTYSMSGDHKAAKEFYLKSLEINPKLEKAILNLGVTYRILKDYDLAKKYFHKVTEINPKSEKPWIGLGNIQVDLKKPKQAIKFYEKALKIKPTSESAITNLGIAYYYVGDLKKAIKQLERSLEIEPETSQTWMALGSCYDRNGEKEKARLCFKKGKELEKAKGI